MAGPLDLHALAQELLDASVESLNTIPSFDPGLGGAPDRSFISPGLPVFDCCEMLTVHNVPITEADTTTFALGAGKRHARINLIALVVSAVRCVPTVGATENDLPSIEEMEAAAEQINADAWALWNHLWHMWKEEQLFTRCGQVYWDGLLPIAPEGGCVGSTVNFRVSLDGYDDVVFSS